MELRKSQPKTYIITWYGPFHDNSEVEEWESSQKSRFNLYLIQGKKKNAKIYSYYCGKTERSCTARFKDKHHPISQLPNNQNIWIGTFCNRFKSVDIDIAENLIIYLLSTVLDETQLLNERKLILQPQVNIIMLTQWINPHLYRLPEYPIKQLLPEIVVYEMDSDTVKVSKKLRAL